MTKPIRARRSSAPRRDAVDSVTAEDMRRRHLQDRIDTIRAAVEARLHASGKTVDDVLQDERRWANPNGPRSQPPKRRRHDVRNDVEQLHLTTVLSELDALESLLDALETDEQLAAVQHALNVSLALVADAQRAAVAQRSSVNGHKTQREDAQESRERTKHHADAVLERNPFLRTNHNSLAAQVAKRYHDDGEKSPSDSTLRRQLRHLYPRLN